jgi:hypothetical protein
MFTRMKLRAISGTILMSLCLASPLFAQKGAGRGGSSRSSSRSAKSSKGTSSSGVVHVRGYTRKDGTYVAAHDRTAPNDTKLDNWSTKGNINPETGKPGTKNPENNGVIRAAWGNEKAADGAPVTNSDIVEMLGDGVESADVKAIILDARSDFDTCAGALKELKRKGVSDEIIVAMVTSTLSGEAPAKDPVIVTATVDTPKDPASRSSATSPELRGFRLGMSAKSASPKINDRSQMGHISEPNRLGVQHGFLYGIAEGVSDISLEFLDGTLESVKVEYNSSVQWPSEQEFLSTVATRLGLSNSWGKGSTRSEHRIIGAGFYLDAQFNMGIAPTLHLYDPTAQEAIKVRQAQEEERKRGAFKP